MTHMRQFLAAMLIKPIKGFKPFFIDGHTKNKLVPLKSLLASTLRGAEFLKAKLTKTIIFIKAKVR